MKKSTRILALVMTVVIFLGACPAFAESIFDIFPREDGPITLTVYSQLANYSGMQGGWSATLLEDKFNVKVNIIPDSDGTYETRMESGNLGDIVVWGSNGEDYQNAVDKGMLLDWEEDDLMQTWAPYITENYTAALEANRKNNGNDKIHGFGFNVATTEGAHQSFFYTWDLRWDLYKELGYPAVKDLDGLLEVFKQMKAICPTDENGNETYAVSVWPDWDGSMVMYVKALATAYYGYDELGIGHLNPTNGEYYDCLAEGSPYMECLKFFNKLYQNDLLDPNSMTQTFEKMSEKLKAAGTFWSIFNYAGSMAFNTTEHLEDGKYMYAMVPEEAKPIVYGLGNQGGNRIWSIGADTEYPELCLAVLDWLATPEGSMTMWYGPKGLMWDYNEQGGMYFTELGNLCNKDSKYDLTGVEWTSPDTGNTYTLSNNFNDGCLQINNTTLSKDMINPEGKLGEAFNSDTWASQLAGVVYPIQQDWRDYTGYTLAEQYMENHPYLLMPDVNYKESAKDDTLKVVWGQVTKAIVTYSWRAIYAKSDAEYNFHVREMRKICDQYGYDKCVEWSRGEANAKWDLCKEVLGIQ